MQDEKIRTMKLAFRCTGLEMVIMDLHFDGNRLAVDVSVANDRIRHLFEEEFYDFLYRFKKNNYIISSLNIHVGEEVTWEVTVQNLGPEVSVNTKVHDVIPEGLEYLSHSASKGVFNPQTGIWDIGDLTVDDGQVTLYITCKAITVGEKINKATLTSDTFNLNNKSYEEEDIDVLDDDSDHEKVKKQMISDIYNTGNPLFLMLISLFCMMSLPFVKR